MKHHTWLHHASLTTMLLAAGVLGGLLTPHGAEAGTPTLTLDGNSITLVQGGSNCPSGADKTTWLAFNGTTNGQPLAVDKSNGVQGCYSIANLQTTSASPESLVVGNWTLGNYDAATGNRARVLVNDTMGSDWMKVSGITIFPMNATTVNATAAQITSSTLNGPDGTACISPPAACQVGVLTLTNTFNASGAENNKGSFSWGMSVDGSIDLNGSENAANDRFRIIGTGCETVPCTPPTRGQNPAAGNGTGGRQVGNGTFVKSGNRGTTTVPPVERNQGAGGGVITSTSTITDPLITANNGTTIPVMDSACDSLNGKCTPTLRMDYVLWLQGRDMVKMGDSINSCSGSCNPTQTVTTPAKKFILKCEDPPDPLHPEIPTLATQCNQQIQGAAATEKGLCIGCVEPAFCEGTCIIMTMNGTPPKDAAGKTFVFGDVSGQGVSPFEFKLDSNGYAEKTFSNLTPDLIVTPDSIIDRFFKITSFDSGGSQGLFQTDSPTCSSRLNNTTGQVITRWEVGFAPDATNSSTKVSLTVFTLGEGDLLTCNWHVH